MLEEVCKHPQNLATTLLQHAERIRKLNQQEGKQMKWPAFREEEEEEESPTAPVDYPGSLGVGECAAACEKSVAAQQAISIFRALDMDASGILTEASLIRGMSSWIASKGGDRGAGRGRGEGGMEAGSVSGIAGGEHLQVGSGGSTGLASVPEETAPSVSDMAESEANVAASAHPSLPGKFKFQVIGAENAYVPGTPAAAAADSETCSTAAHAPPPHAPTASHAASAGLQLMEVSAMKVDGKMDRMMAKELAALRHEDLAVLQAKLRQVEHTHREATARISRVELREGALCEHEAAVKRLEGQLQEQEAKLQERERAVKEQVAHAGVLRAEMTHKAQQLEDTARMLQQRKAAVEHRESLLQKQVCSVSMTRDACTMRA